MRTTQAPEPQPAATVVLLRPGHADGPEVLLTQRPDTLAFAGGMHVFPGGRVDVADSEPQLAARSLRGPAEAALALGNNVEPDEALALHVAAIRELLEEAGVLLADHELDERTLGERRERLLLGRGFGDALDGLDVRLRTDRLAAIAHWTTPPFMPRRFSTWFFVADLPPDVTPTFAAGEVAGHRWLTPTAALDQLATGDIQMWIPTSSVLQRLVETGAATAAELSQRLVIGRTPPPQTLEDGPTAVRLAFGAVGALPGRRGITTLHGERDLVLVDPGDPSDAALAAIEEVVGRRTGAIRAIVLTETDPDHAAAAEAVAIPLGIQILVAPGGGRHLPYPTREVADGERLPADTQLHVRLDAVASGRLEVVAG